MVIASLSLALAAGLAPAALPAAASHFSVVTGETVAPDRDAIAFQMGWPGLTFGYLHGLSNSSDIGLKVDVLYAREGVNDLTFGGGAAIPLRLVVNRHEKVLIGLHMDPGVRVYTKSGVSSFFTRLPVGGVFGIQATPELRLAASADVPLAFQWSHTKYFQIGFQFGFAAEYYVDPNLLAGLNFHFGPQYYSFDNSPTDFSFAAEVVIGYRM